MINYIFTDLDESYVLTLKNSVLHHRRAAPDPTADATVRLTRPLLVRLATGQAGLRELVFSDELSVEGSRLALVDFLRLFDTPEGDFPIVTRDRVASWRLTSVATHAPEWYPRPRNAPRRGGRVGLWHRS